MRPRSRDLWVIEFESPDSSQCFTNSYRSKEKAVSVAISWIKDSAKNELDELEWKPGEEAPEMLKEILKDIDENRYDDAIYGWLEYQNEYDPQDTIAIGPSGQVSDKAGDYQYHSPGGARSNPRDFRDDPRYSGCYTHGDEPEDCKADPKACRWTCDAHESGGCITPTSRHYADTKSFLCDEARKQFLKDYRWDDDEGWVERR
jgi:hypothetical protein